MYVNSSSNCSWLEQMLFALCSNEFITLNLLAMAWWLSHCKYWFVWVGLLYIEVDKLPSLLASTRVSKRVLIHHLCVFNCKLYFFFYGIYMLEEFFFVLCFQNDKSVIHKPFPMTWGMWSCFKSFCFKVLHIYISHNGAEWWPHCCIQTPLKPGVFLRETFSHTPDEARSVGLA